jgi:hypothetical protein
VGDVVKVSFKLLYPRHGDNIKKIDGTYYTGLNPLDPLVYHGIVNEAPTSLEQIKKIFENVLNQQVVTPHIPSVHTQRSQERIQREMMHRMESSEKLDELMKEFGIDAVELTYPVAIREIFNSMLEIDPKLNRIHIGSEKRFTNLRPTSGKAVQMTLGHQDVAKHIYNIEHFPNLQPFGQFDGMTSINNIPYFFKTEKTWNYFKQLVSQMIKKNGIFIALMHNGLQVYQATSRKGVFQNKYGSLIKKYQDPPPSIFGNLYMYNGDTFYLVDVNFLIEEMKKLGFKLISVHNILEWNIGKLISQADTDMMGLYVSTVFQKL